jgi:hypothetical protein
MASRAAMKMATGGTGMNDVSSSLTTRAGAHRIGAVAIALLLLTLVVSAMGGYVIRMVTNPTAVTPVRTAQVTTAVTAHTQGDAWWRDEAPSPAAARAFAVDSWWNDK